MFGVERETRSRLTQTAENLGIRLPSGNHLDAAALLGRDRNRGFPTLPSQGAFRNAPFVVPGNRGNSGYVQDGGASGYNHWGYTECMSGSNQVASTIGVGGDALKVSY